MTIQKKKALPEINELKQQMAEMASSIATMAEKLQSQCLERAFFMEDEYFIRKNYLYYYLSKFGFRGHFCHQFVQSFLKARKSTENINEESVHKALVRFIRVYKDELIAKKRVLALIGPTGAGKTTTIIKLAKRYLLENPVESIGLITTNCQDLLNKNYLLNYSEKLGIDLEYANMPKELSLALTAMKNKRMVLIDNAGYSQYDEKNITHIRSLLESQGGLLEAYLTLPCNLHDVLIDEIIRANITANTYGCILTKQDEAISLGPVISACMQYRLKIAYICNGQDLSKDIHLPTAENIVTDIVTRSNVRKQKLERTLKRNMRRVEQLQEEAECAFA